MPAHEFAGEVRARVESRLGFRVGGQDHAGARPNWASGSRPARCWRSWTRRTTGWRPTRPGPRWRPPHTNRDLAAADYKRYKELKDQNFISGAELERREATLKAAQAQLEQAQAQLAAQGNQAGYTKLVADVSGVVTAVEAEPGQVVTAGTPVVRIAADGPRDVVFSVPEDKVAAIKVGSPVAGAGVGADQPVAGAVREVAASADPVTRTYAVKVALDAREPPALGATVYVEPRALSAAGVQVIKLPTSALRQDGKASCGVGAGHGHHDGAGRKPCRSPRPMATRR